MIKSIYELKAVAVRDKNDQLEEYTVGDGTTKQIILYGYRHVDIMPVDGARIFYPYHQIIRGDYND